MMKYDVCVVCESGFAAGLVYRDWWWFSGFCREGKRRNGGLLACGVNASGFLSYENERSYELWPLNLRICHTSMILHWIS